MVSQFVKFAFEHVVHDKLHVFTLSGMSVAKMGARRHLKLGAVLNDGNWKR